MAGFGSLEFLNSSFWTFYCFTKSRSREQVFVFSSGNAFCNITAKFKIMVEYYIWLVWKA